jgi:hypothetical protein
MRAHRVLLLQGLGMGLGCDGVLERTRIIALSRRNRRGLRSRHGFVCDDWSNVRSIFAADDHQAFRRIPLMYDESPTKFGSSLPHMRASISALVRGDDFVLRRPICRLVVLGKSIGLSDARGASLLLLVARSAQ